MTIIGICYVQLSVLLMALSGRREYPCQVHPGEAPVIASLPAEAIDTRVLTVIIRR